MPILYIALGFVAGWYVRSGRDAPPLPSAREMIALAASGDEGMKSFIALVEQRAQQGDKESLDTYWNLQDAMTALSRGAAPAALPAPIPIDSNPVNANPKPGRITIDSNPVNANPNPNGAAAAAIAAMQ